MELEAFTDAQRRAITAGDGPLAVMAGPGCGKTTTLAGRIAYLVHERQVDPASILALSFTTEAARRLRREVARQLGGRADDVAVMTLHALGRKVIDTWAGRLGYDARPVVLPVSEAHALLASTAAAHGWNAESVSISELAAAVDRLRLAVDESARQGDPLTPLANAYEERLRRHGAVDFVSMLSLPLRLFREDQRPLRVLQDAYAWVIADEVQDMTPTQWELVHLLSAQQRNLLVAGDAAQGIYAWTGADIRLLLTFPQRYPEAEVVTLDQSHRATGHLVAVANAVGDLLEYRSPLTTSNPPGPLPKLLLAEDPDAEAEFVARQVRALLDRRLLPHPGEAAVLYRTRAQSDVLAAAFRSAGLPYTLRGQADLFGARSTRDVLGYLRLAVNPSDRAALARIVDRPPRGLQRLAAILVEEPATAPELPMRATELGPAVQAAVAALLATIYDLHAAAERGAAPAPLLDRALERSGYRAWLERHPDGTTRLRTLARLRVVAAATELSLAAWLEAVALGEDVTPLDEEATCLSSVHRSKGREWRATFTVGLEEGLIPHRRAATQRLEHADGEALEEELRVLYVALTRARERLYLSACQRRSQGGRIEWREPSRWLYALPPELLAPAA